MDTSRRGFMMTTLAAGSTALLASASGNKPKWRIGLGLNGFMSSAHEFKKSYPLWEVLNVASKEGFDGIELVEGWPTGPYPKAQDKEKIAALKRLYDQYGLQIYTIQNGGGAAHSVKAETRKRWIKEFRGRVSLCKQLGCSFVGHWPGGGLGGNRDVGEAITHLVKSYREAAQICADAGMHMSFEIEPPFIFNTPEHLERILAEVDHPACKTNYDPSHFDLMWGSKGKPEEMLQRIGVQHIGHVHLTDTDGTQFAGTSKHLACGDGHCDIPASLRMLRDGGYSGWIMIDAWKIEDAYRACRMGKKAIEDVVRAS